jgi:hypothetical protein
MARPSKHILTPRLERQLEHIELIGNAEAHLAAQESAEISVPRNLSASKVSISEQQHRLDTAREQFLRETARTKKFGYILLGLVPLTCLTYVASILLNNPKLGVATTLLSGLLIGFGIVVIVMSNRNLKGVSSTSDR